jgi:hypothetical protein
MRRSERKNTKALLQKSTFIVPPQKFGVRPVGLASRQMKNIAVQPSILLAVIEHFFDFPTDKESVIRIDGGVPCIENAVNVFSKKNSVRLCVGAPLRIRTNVRGVERGQHLALGHGALTAICFSDCYSKSPLPQSRRYQSGLTVPNSGFRKSWSRLRRPSLRNILQSTPKIKSISLVRGNSASHLRCFLTTNLANPSTSAEEKIKALREFGIRYLS